MSKNAKLSNPICLHLGENGKFIVTPGGSFRVTKTVPTMGTHYGFVVSTKLEKTDYPTAGKICAVGVEQDMVQVYEEGKDSPWKIDVSGALIEKAYSEKPKQKVKRL